MLKRNLKKRRCWGPLIIKGNTTTHHNNLGCIVFRELTCFNCFSIPILIILSFQFIRHTLIQLMKSKNNSPNLHEASCSVSVETVLQRNWFNSMVFLPAHVCAPVEFDCILLRSQYSHWYEQCKKKKLCRWFHNAWMFVLRWGESGRGVARWENREEAEGKRAEDRHTARSQTETCNAKKEKLHLYRSSARICLFGELFPEESERSCDLRRKGGLRRRRRRFRCQHGSLVSGRVRLRISNQPPERWVISINGGYRS